MLLHKAKDGGFDICLAEEILEEVQRALLQYQKIRKRYHSTDQTVIQFVQNLRIVAHLITGLPSIEVVNSDPNDNMVVACARKARENYIVTRDNDLLSLKNYEGVKIVTPLVIQDSNSFFQMVNGNVIWRLRTSHEEMAVLRSFPMLSPFVAGNISTP